MDTGTVTRSLVQLGFALLVAASFLAWITITIFRADARFQSWNTADATVLTSAVVRQFDPTMSKGTNNMQQLYWVISVSYQYKVNGENYTGTRYSNKPPLVSAGGGTSPPDSLVALQARLTPGAIVPIHYAPNDPQSSYVVIISDRWRWPLIILIMLLAAAVAAFGFALRR